MHLIMIWFLGTLVLAAFSWKAFADRRSSRFFRFLAEVALLASLIYSSPSWFRRILSLPQILSWLILVGALILGLGALSAHSRNRNARLHSLVTAWPYSVIRHPMYASLILLAWGASFKDLAFASLLFAIIVTTLYVYCAYLEELENCERFGEAYDSYTERTKMFLPGIF